MIDYQCPKCKEEMCSPDSLAGMQETCPSCGNVTIIPIIQADPKVISQRFAVNIQRVILIVLAAMGMLCTFLPWASIPLWGSVYGTKGDGWITFVLFIVSLYPACRGGVKKPLYFRLRVYSMSVGILAIFIAIQKMADFSDTTLASDYNPFAEALISQTSLGIGLYLMAIVGAGMLMVNIYGQVKDIKNWIHEKRLR